MECCNSQEEYIEAVALAAQKACKRFEIELGQPFYTPSTLIAQSCHENGYSMADDCKILVTINNMCGIKRNLLNSTWTDIGLGVWDGQYLNKSTPEVYGGRQVTIKADFRIYKDVEQSFVDYLCFMRWGGYSLNNPKYYPHLKDLHDYASIIKVVHKLGYATGVTYSDAIIKKIQKHSLDTRFDDLTNIEPSEYFPTGASGNVKEEKKEETTNKQYIVQVGLFAVKENADRLKQKMLNAKFDCIVVVKNGHFRVQCGAFSNKSNADALVKRLADKNIKSLIIEE